MTVERFVCSLVVTCTCYLLPGDVILVGSPSHEVLQYSASYQGTPLEQRALMDSCNPIMLRFSLSLFFQTIQCPKASTPRDNGIENYSMYSDIYDIHMSIVIESNEIGITSSEVAPPSLNTSLHHNTYPGCHGVGHNGYLG